MEMGAKHNGGAPFFWLYGIQNGKNLLLCASACQVHLFWQDVD